MLDDIVNELARGIRPGCHFHFNLDSECASFNLQLMMDNPDFFTAKISNPTSRLNSASYLRNFFFRYLQFVSYKPKFFKAVLLL